MSVDSKKRLIEELKDKEFRDAYFAEHVKTSVPIQIRAIRENKFHWSQADLAEHANTKQSAISRLEDTDYGNLSINNLLKIVSAFDAALLVKIVSPKRLLQEFENLAPEVIADINTFDEDLPSLVHWATIDATNTVPKTVYKPSETDAQQRQSYLYFHATANTYRSVESPVESAVFVRQMDAPGRDSSVIGILQEIVAAQTPSEPRLSLKTERASGAWIN